MLRAEHNGDDYRFLDAHIGAGIALDLQGNGWPFHRGDRLRLELTQDDEPYLKASSVPSSLTLSGATLVLPVR